MTGAGKAQYSRQGYPWFKASIAIGMLLGLVLLAQTITTYYYVAGSLVRQEAAREAERKLASLGRSARAANIHDGAALGPVIDELRRESPQEIAWIRITRPDGGVLAETGKPDVAPAARPSQRRAPPNREKSEVRNTATGKFWSHARPCGLASDLVEREEKDPHWQRSSWPLISMASRCPSHGSAKIL